MAALAERISHRYSVMEAEEIKPSSDVTLPKRRVKVTLVSVGPGNKVDLSYYTQKAINSGPAIFEGVRCFLNHASKLQQAIQPERTQEELCGYFSDVQVEGEKCVGVLNILDGPEFDDLWNKIKAAIAYSKQYPGRVILGLSIAAEGDCLPIQIAGKTWKAVQRFTNVKSVDIVTYPARGGEFQQVLSESEAFDQLFEAGMSGSNAAVFTRASEAEPEAGAIFSTLKDHVTGLRKSGAPGAEETSRIVDKLGTALKLNKTEDKGTMDPIPQQPAGSPDNDFTSGEAFRKEMGTMAETYGRQAQTEADQAIKGHKMKMAEALKKMSEGGLTITHNPGPAAPPAGHPAPMAPAAQSEEERVKAAAEAEAKRQAEAGTTPKLPGGLASEAEKSETKYLDLLKSTLLEKSGLPETTKKLLKATFLESVRDETKIRSIISTYQEAFLQESSRQAGHGIPRQDHVDGGAKQELKNARPGLKKLLASVKA